MTVQMVKLIDQSSTVLAVAHVTDEGDIYGGAIDLSQTPASVRGLFQEFEEIINGQMFTFLDEIQGRMAALSIKAVFGDGGAIPISDLQVYPSTNEVSFRVAAQGIQAQRRRN